MSMEPISLESIMNKALNEGGNAFLTMGGFGLMMKEYFIPQVQAMLEQSPTACVQQEWGSVSDAAKVLSMTKQGAVPYFSRWIAEGKLRVREVESIEGKKSRRLYNLADVSQCVNNAKCPDDVFINS